MWLGIIVLTLLLLGTPVGVVLGVGGLFGMYQIGGEAFMQVAPSKIFNGLNIFPFLAMPFFILAGEIMNHTGITQRVTIPRQSRGHSIVSRSKRRRDRFAAPLSSH